jgi:RNA-directed DNA polymerase
MEIKDTQLSCMNMPSLIKNYDWDTIEWTAVYDIVSKYQREIYAASKNLDIKKVRDLQHQLLSSTEAKMLAVQKVTQNNQRNTQHEVHKFKKLVSVKRTELANSLTFPYKTSVLKRLWISKKGRLEGKFLNLSIIKNRCLQFLLKIALEPEWKARFEKDSFLFKAQNTHHDTILFLRSCLQKKPCYVLDTYINECFDKVNCSVLLDKIGLKGKYRFQIKYWLESGMVSGVLGHNFTGSILHGGVLSPLLRNIVLHGLESYLTEIVERIPMTFSLVGLAKLSQKVETLGISIATRNYELA